MSPFPAADPRSGAAPTVLVVGDLGTRDPGTASLLQALERGLGGRRPVLTSGDPARTRAHTGLDAVRGGDGAALWRELRRADGLVLVDGALNRGRPALAGRADARSAALRLCLAARATGTPVALFTVAAAHLGTVRARLRARALVGCADLVVLRDRASADTLARAGAPAPFRIGADVTWAALSDGSPAAVSPAAVPPGAVDRDELVVVLDATQDRRGAAARLGAAVARVAADRHLRVRLVPWRLARAGDDDLDLARAVGDHVPDALVDVPPADLHQMRELAANARVVVTSRLHALHAAAAAGTPAVARSTEEESTRLALDLGQRTLAPHADVDTIVARISAALDGPVPRADVVAERVDTAERSLRLLRLLLARGATDDDLQGIALPLQPAPGVTA